MDNGDCEIFLLASEDGKFFKTRQKHVLFVNNLFCHAKTCSCFYQSSPDEWYVFTPGKMSNQYA